MRKPRVWLLLIGACLLLAAGWVLFGSKGPEPWVAPPADIAVISTRNAFDQDGDLLSGHAPDSYEILGSIPGLKKGGGAGPGDLIIVIHGFNNSPDKAVFKFGVAQEGLRRNGYEGAIAGYSWDSDRQRDNLAITGYHTGRQVAVGNARMLAQFLKDYHAASPSTRIHLIGYSMGARLALETLRYLDIDPQSCGPEILVSSVHLVGAAVDDDEVEQGQKYARGIEGLCGQVFNYYSPEDNKLGAFYWPKEADRALGETGIEHPDKALPNYHDIDVTQELHSYTKAGVLREGEEGDNHSGYLGNRGPDGKLLDDGVMDLVARNIAKL